jgi:hypothetical protein
LWANALSLKNCLWLLVLRLIEKRGSLEKLRKVWQYQIFRYAIVRRARLIQLQN